MSHFFHGISALLRFIHCSVEITAVALRETFILSSISQPKGILLKNVPFLIIMLDMTESCARSDVSLQQTPTHILYVIMGTVVPSSGKTENQRFL